MRRRLVIDQPVERDDRRNRKGRKPEKSGPPVSPKQKAQDLVDKGMPYQMAMAVVHGRMELNEALERLSRRDRVNQLMERYDLSRALATQVAIGHADLDLILKRRRLQTHRDGHRDRTCLVPGETLSVARFGADLSTLTVKTVEAYGVIFTDESGADVEVHKLELKFAYDPAEWKKVRKALRRDKKLAAEDQKPAKQPQDRYTCSDKRMFGYVDSGKEVAVTMVDGDSFRGAVSWFSRYEFGLKLKGDAEVTVFRHALHDLSHA